MRSVRPVFIVLAVAACRADCGTVPCPAVISAEVTVTSSVTNAPLDGVTIRMKNGDLLDDGCHSVCSIEAGARDYDIVISAPGYQPAERTFTVTAKPRAGCGCEVDNTQLLSVALTPI